MIRFCEAVSPNLQRQIFDRGPRWPMPRPSGLAESGRIDYGPELDAVQNVGAAIFIVETARMPHLGGL